MRKMLRYKIAAIAAVLLVFASVGVYPIVASRFGLHSPSWLMDKHLKLGLDLEGGVHLVLRVETEEALRVETHAEADRVRDAIRTAHLTPARVSVVSPVQFSVEGIPEEQSGALVEATGITPASFDVSTAANGAALFTMKPGVQVSLRAAAVAQARQTIERRVNELGVAEPNIAQQGEQGDQILVELPGVSDVPRAKAIIRSTGVLELKIVEGGPAATRDELLRGGQMPDGLEIVPGAADGSRAEGDVFYLVRTAAAVTGNDLRSARPSLDANNQPDVRFTLTTEGSRRFGAATEQNIGRRLAVILDGRVQSAPSIEQRITGEGSIHGSFTSQEAQNLSTILRSGALRAPLTYIEERTIGPGLGADSIRSGVLASAVGLLLIVSFMLIYYRLSGVNAVMALLLNLIILLGLMAYLGAVMTLPGIAGFVLTMGIGVDSNVLIFERIKEELEASRGTRAAVSAGFSRVFVTLLDTHISALIAAGFLFQFGTGPIRGFAVTLSIGLMSNLFTSTFVSKTLFEMMLTRWQRSDTLSI